MFLFIGLYNISFANILHGKHGDLGKYLDNIGGSKRGMGSILISQGEDQFFYKNFGFMKTPSEPIYRIGSITKIYTATIILKLVEQNKLSLDSTLSKFFKGFKKGEEITIIHLLRHRSGLENFTNSKDYYSYFDKKISRETQLQKFRGLKQEFRPGEKYSYSNTGYSLLTYIAEDVSGESYSELLKKYITKPLGLKKTYIFKKGSPLSSEVSSYTKEAKWVVGVNTDSSVTTGAGALASTPKEVSIFLRSLMKGKVLSKKMMTLMKKQVEGYGFGLFTVPYADQNGFAHTGGIDNFRSIIAYFPKDDITLAVFTNALSIEFNDLSLAAMNYFYNKKLEVVKFKEELYIPSDILNKYVGRYASDKPPIVISFLVKDKLLFGQVPGQPAIPFEATSEKVFEYPAAKVKLKFTKDGQSLEFTQGETYLLKKMAAP